MITDCRDHTKGTDGALYILRGDSHIVDSGLRTIVSTPANPRSVARMGDAFYVGDANSHLWKLI